MEHRTDERDTITALRAALMDPDPGNLTRVTASLRPQEILDGWDELTSADRARIVACLSPEAAAELMSNLPGDEQLKMLEAQSPSGAGAVLGELHPDDLADTLQAIDEEAPEHAEAIRSLLAPETLAVAEDLARYAKEAAGGLMTPEFIALESSMTVDQALAYLRQAGLDAETIYYLYVVDESRRLLGVLSLRELIVAALDKRLGEIMDRHVVCVHTDTDQEEVARIMAEYDLNALPVVDEAERLVGIVTVDDILDVVEFEATEDIHRLGAAPVDLDYARAHPLTLFRKRAPWLALLIVSMTLTFNVISHFEDIIAEVVVLAAFIPLLIGTGGNVGAQVATMVVRSLGTRNLEPRHYFRVLAKELSTGLMLGLVFGIFVAAYVMLFQAQPAIALALGITMMLIALTANLVGASLPFLFRRLGIDPALTSSPGITTIMDVVGLLIYFRVVIWVLRL